MKIRVFVLLVVVCHWLLPVHAQPDTSAVLSQAAVAYAQGDYALAASLYQNLAERGVRDGALFFNLGNACFQSGQLGCALVSYRRAQSLTPRDSDLNINLARVRASRVDVLGDQTDFLLALGSSTDGIMPLPELATLAWITGFCVFALLSAAVLYPVHRVRIRVAVGIVGVAAALITGLLFARLWIVANRPPAVVIVPEAVVLSGPGEDYLELYRLHDAAEMNLIDQQGDWLRFSLPDGRQGWIPFTAVERIDK